MIIVVSMQLKQVYKINYKKVRIV